jgi:hypothetical protein
VTHPHILAAVLLLTPLATVFVMNALRGDEPNSPAPAVAPERIGVPLATAAGIPSDEVSP